MRANEKLLLCLCQACASQFYYSPEHIIKRVNLNQEIKETCTYCQVREGYDFEITKKKVKRGIK